MSNKGITKEKSFKLAVRIVNLARYLNREQQEFVLSKQILRSGTSVGAMVREGEFAESPSDFIHKFSVAQKEINETIYWLELLHETNYITKEEFQSLYDDSVEVRKLITSSIITLKRKRNEG